jgi:hypothetical protein
LTSYEYDRYGHGEFKLKPVSELTVSKIIKNISTNAQGDDGLNLDMILLTLPRSLNTITTIINKSLETGVFPEQWKRAVIKPIPKTQHPLSYKDLRPISILPFMSKILEKVVAEQMTEYLESNGILPSKQSGFRKGRSTSTALADVVDDILAAQDIGEGSLLVLLDFSRAFDTIDTTLLLSKLAFYGFDYLTLKWFNSYLTGRSQYVKICKDDGSELVSRSLPVVRGVPQGSILGPILFIVYSADIIKHINNCNYHIYADDIQLYTSFKTNSTDTAVKNLNTDLQNISDWCNNNNLMINPSKSKYMILGTKKQVSKIASEMDSLDVVITGAKLERVNEVRNLGLIMDGSLRFEGHVLESMRSCFYRLKVLYRIRECLSVNMRVKLCETLILSKLNYADTVFNGCLLARTRRIIQRIQNACARFCFPVPRRSHITPYLNCHNMMNMDARRNLHFATLLFGVIKSKQPAYLHQKLVFSQRHIRQAPRLICPLHHSAAFRGSFRFAATKCWNDLPPPIRNSCTKVTFKLRLKKFLMDKQKFQHKQS